MGAQLIVPSTGGSAPSGAGFVRATGGAFVDPAAPLGATDIPVFWVATTTRSTNAFSGSLPTTPALVAGLCIQWQVPSAPSGAATYNLNSLGAKNIFARGSANAAADLPANRIVTMLYDGTQWQIVAANTLVPGDMPAKNTLVAQLSSQNVTTSAPTLAYGTPSVNDCFTYSSGVWTCTVAGTYLIEACMTAAFSDVSAMGVKKNGSFYGPGCAFALNLTPSIVISMILTVGQTFEITGYCAATRALDVSTASTSYLRATRML